MLKAFVIVALIAAFVLFASMVGMIVYSSEEAARDDQKQPTVAEHSNSENGSAPANENANQHATESKKKREWYYIFTDHTTDWLLVLFNGLLVAATIALFVSGERNVDVARKSAIAAQKAANVAEGTLVATNRPWIQVKSIGIASPLGFGREYGNDVGGGVNLTLVVRNVGKSPAIRIGADIQLAFR
jgi:hypothetical protein